MKQTQSKSKTTYETKMTENTLCIDEQTAEKKMNNFSVYFTLLFTISLRENDYFGRTRLMCNIFLIVCGIEYIIIIGIDET